jgi:hypothetical protein
MLAVVRSFLLVEAAAFFLAALVHGGVLVQGYEHWKAGTAESVIGAVLLVGLIVSYAAPRSSRTAGLFAQGFALLGTCVGLFTIAIGIGPRTAFDLVLHAFFVAILIVGLVLVARGRELPA